MTKVEAIIKVLEDNHGIASWNIIYNQIGKYYPNIKLSKEWQAGIRGVLYREIRNGRYFKNVGLSLFALKDYKEESIEEVKHDNIRMHSYIEGICLEIGNFLNLLTYTADPSAKYNNVLLSEIASIKTVPKFTYDEILDTTRRIDILWFNEKGFQFPKRAIEVIDSIGTLEPALKRTLQLVEFDLSFYILCKKEHVKKVEKELSGEPYKRIKERYFIKDYDSLLDVYKNPIKYKDDLFLKYSNPF